MTVFQAGDCPKRVDSNYSLFPTAVLQNPGATPIGAHGGSSPDTRRSGRLGRVQPSDRCEEQTVIRWGIREGQQPLLIRRWGY